MQGDVQSLQDGSYFKPKYQVDLYAQAEGYIDYLSTTELGLIAVELKAGRKLKTDQIDPHAGLLVC